MEAALFGGESFCYDAASNLMATGTDGWSAFTRKDGDSVAYGRVRHNRLQSLNGYTFSYDAFGRTVEKKHAATNRAWRYAYNAEDQLGEVTAITRSGFRTIRFTDDVFGRRIAKTDGQVETRFTWSGMRLLSESRGVTTSVYVYEPDSYAPLARLDAWNAEFFAAHGKTAPDTPGKVYYFHCNASGMPEEMTDAEGAIVWRARYATLGKVVFENVTDNAPPGRCRTSMLDSAVLLL